MADHGKCPVCGNTRHKDVAAHGITAKVCPRVPAGFVWVDQAFAKGPAGTLIELKKDAA